MRVLLSLSATALIFASALLIAPSFVESASSPFIRSLSVGISGSDVAALQQLLKAEGYYSYPSITGYFGPITQAAVERFQAAHGIVASGTPASTGYGRVGPRTLVALNQVAVSGSTGPTNTPTSTTTAPPNVSIDPLTGQPRLMGVAGGTYGAPSVSVAPADTTAPTVSLTAPTNGSTASSSAVTLSATASDNIGVAGVQFAVDGVNVGSEQTSAPYTITWDSTSVTDGSHSITAIARDAAGNHTTSSPITITVDNRAPVRSAGAPSGTLALNTTSTTISLTTNEAATCKYATTSGVAYGSMTTFTTTGGTSQSSSISGLTNGGSYIYYIKCRDTQGNTDATDYTISFTVAADTTSPTVSVTAPLNNSTVTGSSVAVSANASDDVSVAGVQFKLDTNTNIGAEDTSAPYGVTWDSTGVSDGTHTIIAVARDGSGNYATSSVITITVDNNPPTVAMTAPANSATVSGSSVTLSANASDTVGVVGVQFKVNGVNVGAEDTSAPYSVNWDSTATSSGSKSIVAVARDAVGHYATSTPVSVTVDNTPPVLSSISSGTPSTTSATITWTTDEAAASTVNYGTTSGYGTASTSAALVTSHSITLTGLTSSQTYHFQVASADGQGNVATSSDQTFTTTTTNGTVASAAIDSNGWTADLTLTGLSTGGTYALAPNSTPSLTFNVTSKGYNSSGNQTTVSRTVYGTVPLRQPYPNGTLNTESVNSGNLTTTVALSDDILPTDTVSISSLAGWYTQATSSQAVSGLVPANNSTDSDYRPIGAWVTPTNLDRVAGASMPVEFFVSSRYPRNNGQVAAVSFVISDGTNFATTTVSTMTQSTYLLSATCTATSGSAVLTSCGSTAGMIAGEYVTVSTGSASGVGIGEPKINSVDSATQITLNTNATANGSVKVTIGNPVYVYAATFTNAQLNTLNTGVATVRAIAYPNIGTTVLDTAAGADGTPIAAFTITPNLKNLQFYNDKSSNYTGVYAWVGSSAGASPAVQTSATDPGSAVYYGSIKAAADAIMTYMNANKGHNDACGGYIYLKGVTITGTGGAVSSDVPTNCATNLVIDCDPSVSAGSCNINADASANRDIGYTTLVKNIKFTDNATNKIVLTGPDGASTAARQAHIIFQNDWIVETQASPSAYFNQIGWRQYYDSFIDQTIGNGKITATFGVTGITNEQFGSTVAGGSTILYNSLGNIYSNSGMTGVGNTSANFIQPTSAVSAFDKLMNISYAPAFISTDDGTNHNNWAFVQDVVEAVGTTNTQTAMSFAADSDTTALANFLRQYTTVVGNRTNFLYESKGTSPIVKTGNDLFDLDYQTNRKSDYFASEGGSSGSRTGSWRWRFGVGDIGDVTEGSTGADSGGSSTVAGYASWLGDFFGLTGATSTQNTNQTSFTFTAANQNSSGGGNNTGLGYYKPVTTTGLTNRVPAGDAGFPGDIEGTPRKNGGTGCAGAYECQ